MGEVLLEKVVKCLRLQNPGTGQVQGTMFGKEQGVGPPLAARPGQVLGLLQTCGHEFPHFPHDEPSSGSLWVRAEVKNTSGDAADLYGDDLIPDSYYMCSKCLWESQSFA